MITILILFSKKIKNFSHPQKHFPLSLPRKSFSFNVFGRNKYFLSFKIKYKILNKKNISVTE